MSSPVARRYAQALYQEADAKGAVDRTDDDVQTLRETFRTSRELKTLVESPIVGQDKKEAVLNRLFAEHLAPLTMRFMHLLLEKEREDELPAVIDAYAEQRDRRLGIVEAHVKTARPLSADEVEKLRERLAERTGKDVRLRLDVEPELIGGLVVRIDDTVYDRSVRHQLGALREQLAERVTLSQN